MKVFTALVVVPLCKKAHARCPSNVFVFRSEIPPNQSHVIHDFVKLDPPAKCNCGQTECTTAQRNALVN